MARAKASGWLPLDHLAHLDRTDRAYDGIVITSDSYYTLYPVFLPRPDSGVENATIVCGSCQETVRCKVYSISATERAYRRTSAGNLALVLIAVIAFGAFLAAAFGLLHGPIGNVWILRALLTVALVAGLLAYTGVFFLRLPDRATGVRLLRSEGHSLRAAGSTHDYKITPMPT